MKSAGLKLHQHRPGNLGTCVVGVNAVASAANGDVVAIEPRGSGAFARFPKIYVGRTETFPEQRAVVGLRPSLKHIELY